MERVEAKLMAWKGLYEELASVQTQLAQAIEAGDVERVDGLKNEAARLAMRSDSALQAVHEALKQRKGAAAVQG